MNINNLPLVEELSDEQSTNIMGGMEAIKLEIDTGGGSSPGISHSTPPPPPPPIDEETPLAITLFS